MARVTIGRPLLILACWSLVGPVAVHAKTHQERFFLKNPVHLCNIPVTRLTFDIFGQMTLVAEIDMIGKIVDAHPFDRFSFFVFFCQFLNEGAVGFDHAMAVHADV